MPWVSNNAFDKLVRERRLAIEALKFYADEGHYEEDIDARNERIMTSVIKKDEGKRAREALQSIGDRAL